MKLHLGSGSVRFEGWLNVDLDAPSADMHLDLRQVLPFEDESVEYIMNEHFIEHLTRDEALAFLKECHRVLRADGVLRLSTPDLEFLTVRYLARDIEEWKGLWLPETPCRMMNEGMRSWGHQFMYDAEELSGILAQAGFGEVRFARWRESAIPDLVGLEDRPFHGELIVEASRRSRVAAPDDADLPAGVDGSWQDAVSTAALARIRDLEQTVADQSARIRALEAGPAGPDATWRGRLGSAADKLRRH